LRFFDARGHLRAAVLIPMRRRIGAVRSALQRILSRASSFAYFWLLIVGLFLLSGQLGGISSAAGHLAALAIAVAFTAYHLCREHRGTGFKDWLFKIAILGGALAGLFATPWPYLRVLCYAVWMCGLVLWSPAASDDRQRVFRVAKGSFLAGILLAILSLIPSLWLFLNAFSVRFTSFFNGAAGGASLGASASGLVVLLILGCFILADGFRSKKPSSMCWVIASLALLFIHHAASQGFATTELARAVGKAAYIGIAALLLQWYLMLPTSAHGYTRPASRKARRVGALIATIGALVGALFIAGLPSLWFREPSEPPVRILLLDHGMLASWSTPSDKPPGAAFSGASFGLLPQHLRAYGYETEISSKLSDAELQDRDVVIIINPGDDFSEAEKQLLSRFVADGNGLLAMGDHTDVGGIMRVLNGLLDPFGAGLRFDSAVPAQTGWQGALQVNHPLRLRYDPGDVPVSIGASLWVRPRLAASPLLVGSRAFSDPGDRENTKRALLGNLSYDRGESYGEIVLAAACHFGKGKVAVFGDTQAFQNTGMSFSHGYLFSLIEWMVAGPPTWVPVATAIAALCFLGSAVYFLSRRLTSVYILALLGACTVAGFLVGSLLTAGAITGPPLTESEIAYVDLGHNNIANRRTLAPDGLGGLLVNLSRQGYVPVVTDEPFSASIRPGRGLMISIVPTRPFSASDSASLRAFLETGGTAIISTSWPYAKAVSTFLGALGLEIGNTPLGEVQALTPEGDPGLQFTSAWPLYGSSDWVSLCSVKIGEQEFAVVAQRTIGEGLLVVVADESFFLTEKLEGDEFYNEQTVNFLNGLLDGGGES